MILVTEIRAIGKTVANPYFYMNLLRIKCRLKIANIQYIIR